MEGTVPVHPFRPGVKSDDEVFPVQVVSDWWRAEAAGVKKPWAFSLLFNISYKNRSTHIECRNCYHSRPQLR
jgi:hypothetical protein